MILQANFGTEEAGRWWIY